MKKPQIKINFLYYGTPFDIKKNFFVNLLKKKYNVIISNEPDFVFFSVYKNNNKFLSEDGKTPLKTDLENRKSGLVKKILGRFLEKDTIKEIIWFLRENKILKPYAKFLGVNGDFVKIFYTSEVIKPDMSKCNWAFGPFYESEINNTRYMRIPPYIMSGSNFDLKKDKFSLKQIKKEKTRFCNFIYDNPIYLRNNFFRKLSKYKRVDSPGKCMNNMAQLGGINPQSRGANDFMKKKLRFISEYKFTIGFESRSSSGWVTEKLIDPMLVNSIPIYFGPKDINKEFNTRSFINFHDFRNMEDFISYIIKVDKDDELYEKILKEPWLKNNRPSVWMDDGRILSRFKRIFG